MLPRTRIEKPKTLARATLNGLQSIRHARDRPGESFGEERHRSGTPRTGLRLLLDPTGVRAKQHDVRERLYPFLRELYGLTLSGCILRNRYAELENRFADWLQAGAIS